MDLVRAPFLTPAAFKTRPREPFGPIAGVMTIGPKEADLRLTLLKFFGHFAN